MSPFRMYRRAALSLLLLLALLFCQSARSAGSAPMPSTTTVTVSVTLTGKDANGVPFTTVRHLDIPLAGTPDGMAVSAAINGAASGGKAHVAFALDGPTQTLAPSAPPGVAVTPRPTTADGNALPDLAQPSSSPLRFQPGAQGITITDNDASRRFVVDTETSQATGTSIGFRGAMLLSDLVALGGGVRMGRDTRELFASLGLRLSDTQRLMLTGGQLRQHLDYRFPSGKAKAEMTQNSAGGAWRVNLGSGLLDYAEATAYTARTASRDLGAVNFFIDTATLYELWNDPRRIAGSTLNGVQGKLGLRPWEGGRASFGFGQERLRYDLLNGDERHTRATGSLALEQAVGASTRLRIGADSAAAQNRVSVGVDHRFDTLGTLGLDLVNLRGRDGIGNDNRVQLSWNIPLGRGAGAPPFPLAMASTGEAPRAAPMRPLAPDAPAAPGHRPGPGNTGLLDQVATRPTWMPAQVVAKVDTSAGPTRLIAVDKAALPAGSSVNTATGAISIPLGIVVAGIASVTKNAGAFVNAGQFSLSDNNLVVNPILIVQPAAGVVDVYVVTVNAAGGGTALVTVNISHGSVKVDSIVITSVSAPVAPTAGAVGISGTAQVGHVLTGQYTYADANADAQGTSTFRWLRNGVAIAGATAITYTPVAADIATTLTFEVTPVSTVAPTAGTPVVSAATAAVLGAGAAVPPTAGAVSIAGTAQVGQTLTGYYTYADANGDPQGASTFRWLRNGVAIAGATAITYPLVNADYGNTVTFEVTPVATTAPTTGTAVMSSATATVVGAGTPAAPTASAVAISGTAQLGQLLTGSYTYADANSDPQGASTFRWLRNGVAISGATAITYTPVAADIATTLSFEVTPISTVAPTAGTPVVSTATAAVLGAGAAVPPTASAVAIVGTAQVGQTLTGSYTYADANGDAQGTSTFRWLRNGSAIAGATASTYTLVAADQGNTITFEVTPVATVAPIMGTAVVSAATAVVTATAAAPTASAVVIVGTAQVGQTLTGYYTYADANGDPQGASTFRWLRNGVAIAGATAITYPLVNADYGNTVTFEVTPVATTAPTTGTAVMSSATAIVVGAGTPAAPTASAVAITGTAQVGQQLTGSYTYADANNDPQGASTFRWLRNGVAIAGATAITYTPVAADIATTLSFEVTPISTVAPATGTPVVSAATAAVLGAGAAVPPTAGAVAIVGTAQVGQTLTGSYTYADANGDPQGASTFRWLKNGSVIAGATASTYTLVLADQGNTITFEVTPVATLAPTTGTPVASATTAAVTAAAAAPTASAVVIVGTAQVGQTLTGYYTYADANGDPQGGSTFRWLRNGVAIAGATASTYMPVTADIATTLSFEVTPVSTVVPATGTTVVSAVTAAVLGAGTPTAPTAGSVAISGTAQVGQTLTGSYTYADANNDPQGASTFRWLRNGVAIAGATAITYMPVTADIATTLSFEVTPVSTVVPATGTPVVSAVTAAVLGAGTPTAPTASSVTISGTAQVGQTLTGNYTYADANSDAQGASTFRWLRNGVAIAGATASTYTLVADDGGNTIAFEVTPVSTVVPATGTAVVSATTATVTTPAAPTASAVSITGTTQVGQTLTGNYTYADANGDPQGASTFRWLRNGVAIAGATAITYMPVTADIATTLSFEVTPVSTVVPATGTPVVSAVTAAVLGAGTPTAPTASSVTISGTALFGQTLTGSYTYADANNDPQGTSTFRWLKNGVAISGATAITYIVSLSDIGTTLSFEVTPVSSVAPATGTPVVSAATAVLPPGSAVPPTASAVGIVGTAKVGQTLAGYYSYADANNNPQGASTFRWLRNGVAIAGATAIAYTPVAADVGTVLSFEVTPVSNAAPTVGTPVVSAATAAVLGADPPTASAVSIDGTAQVGQTLTGYYTYASANGDPQGASTFRWLRNGVAIDGATAITYTPVAADVGTVLRFEVTPVSSVAPTAGTPVVSAATVAVLGAGVAVPPTASAVAIGGTAQVGRTLAGYYTYADVNGDPQGASTFRWLRNGVAIAGATASTYTLVAADVANAITFEVTPVSTVAPTTGTAVVSAIVTIPVAPTASAVSITGTTQAGQTLTGNYTYADANGDAQGASTFRWLRSGVAIVGATASTYTLVLADQGNTITFEVTPVATVAPATGTAVVSAATAAITLPAGYVSQGNLLWMPVTFVRNWGGAKAYCDDTAILGQTGWRLPTTLELRDLYLSGAMNGQGWTLYGTWSSSGAGSGFFYEVNLDGGYVNQTNSAYNNYVSCVR